MKVVIVGGGVAGLCTAYYLRKRDVDVTLLESRTLGSRSAASYGNGGWITPAQAGPLPEPGLTLQRMTTREPSLDQLEVAIASLRAVMTHEQLEEVESRVAA